MESKYSFLIKKLDRFYRLYYKNQLLRGLILGACILLCFYLAASFSEFLMYFSVTVRITILIIGALLFIFVFITLILFPFLQLVRIFKQMELQDAVCIISKHFPHLQDRLINTIELSEKAEFTNENMDLLIASINQRIESMHLIPFWKAVTFRENLKYLKVLLPLLFIGGFAWWFYPNIYSSSAERFIHFQQKYKPPAPFSFFVINDSLEVIKGENFTLQVQLKGKYLPAEVYCCFGGNKFLMKQEKGNKFTFAFQNVTRIIPFYIQAEKYCSDNYLLSVLPLPTLLDFSVEITPPEYTGLKFRMEKNLGDFSVPLGAQIKWDFSTQVVDTLRIFFHESNKILYSKEANGKFTCADTFMKTTEYSILADNSWFLKKELIRYKIHVIPDLYPKIQVTSLQDTVRPSAFYFKGIIKDDYGFSRLQFKYITKSGVERVLPLSFDPHLTDQEFYFSFDFGDIMESEGHSLHYFFEVADNDAVNGNKTSRTSGQNFSLASSAELFNLSEQFQDTLNRYFEKSWELGRSLQDDIVQLQESYIQNSGNDWQKQQLYKEIQRKKELLESSVEEIRNEFIQKSQFFNSFGKQDSILLEKQKQIETLLSTVMDEELQKLFEEFNNLAQNFDSKKFNSLGEKLKISFKHLEQLLERNIELLKRYEVESQFILIANQLDQLGESQGELSELKAEEVDEIAINLQRDSLLMKTIEKNFHKALKHNFELEKPFKMPDLSGDFRELEQQMKNTGDLFKEKRRRKAAMNLLKTAKQLNNLSSKIHSGLAKGIQVQMLADTDNLMRLLSNLIQFSFLQEDLIFQLRKVNLYDPCFPEILQQQSFQKEAYPFLQDSLLLLSSRSPLVASAIGNLIFEIEEDLNEVMQFFEERQLYQALLVQQGIMTKTNDLAVFLSETLENLLEQIANAMPGHQLSEKNGKNDSFFPGLKARQHDLKEQLQQLINEMKQGKKQGQNTNRKLAQMLMQQEMYRQALNDLFRRGQLSGRQEKILKEIIQISEQIETDIANFSVNSNTLLRQKKIYSLLLEAESAENQKDIDAERKSKSGNVFELCNPKEIFQYKRVPVNVNDVFYNSNIKLAEYYKRLYLDYMIKLNND